MRWPWKERFLFPRRSKIRCPYPAEFVWTTQNSGCIKLLARCGFGIFRKPKPLARWPSAQMQAAFHRSSFTNALMRGVCR